MRDINIRLTDEQIKIVLAAARDDGSPEERQYTVQKGDTLWAIAESHYGDGAKYRRIFEANQPPLTNPDVIHPGQVLRIPPLPR